MIHCNNKKERTSEKYRIKKFHCTLGCGNENLSRGARIRGDKVLSFKHFHTKSSIISKKINTLSQPSAFDTEYKLFCAASRVRRALLPPHRTMVYAATVFFPLHMRLYMCSFFNVRERTHNGEAFQKESRCMSGIVRQQEQHFSKVNIKARRVKSESSRKRESFECCYRAESSRNKRRQRVRASTWLLYSEQAQSAESSTDDKKCPTDSNFHLQDHSLWHQATLYASARKFTPRARDDYKKQNKHQKITIHKWNIYFQ
uniref:Uncharacterized protein n=1 Tax=Trichogramma kaykai TaxID=54128 RepID=A0ABD2VT17_9HYME